MKPRKEHSRFHLGACNGHGKVECGQRPSSDFHRKVIAVSGFDFRAKTLERIDDALHRPPRKRFVPDKCRFEWKSGHEAGHEPHRCAGISCVEFSRRRLQSAKTAPLNDDRGSTAIDGHAEAAQALQRALAIDARGEVVDRGCAFS